MNIIAEIGINWDGDFKLLIDMIKKAKKSGADGIKIQYLKPHRMYPPNVKFDLPEGKVNIVDYLKEFVLTTKELKKIRQVTDDLGLLFGCTVVDLRSVSVVEPYIDFYKVASSSSNFIQLHEEINKTGKSCVVSTGGATFHEIINIKRYYNKSQLTLLQCNYEYPVESDSVNLDRLIGLKDVHSMYGFSNHSLDYKVIGPMCVSMGCAYFETHVTPHEEHPLKGDHHFSLSFSELKELCQSVRKAEKIKGNRNVGLSAKEAELRAFCYRKAFAKEIIGANTRIRKQDIAWLRNSNLLGVGFDPDEEYRIVNKITKKEIKKGEKILKGDLF